MLRPVATVLFSFAFVLCLQAAPNAALSAEPLGVDLGPSGPVNPRGGEGHAGFADPNRPKEVAHNGHNDVHGTGTVKALDPAAHKITLAHQPIPKIGWPAMTMEFAVAPAVNLSALKPGSSIDFAMEQGSDGMYVIQSIAPAGGGK